MARAAPEGRGEGGEDRGVHAHGLCERPHRLQPEQAADAVQSGKAARLRRVEGDAKLLDGLLGAGAGLLRLRGHRRGQLHDRERGAHAAGDGRICGDDGQEVSHRKRVSARGRRAGDAGQGAHRSGAQQWKRIGAFA